MIWNKFFFSVAGNHSSYKTSSSIRLMEIVADAMKDKINFLMLEEGESSAKGLKIEIFVLNKNWKRSF